MRLLCKVVLYGLMASGLGLFPAVVPAQTSEDPDVIRVDADLVDLKVSVLRLDPLNAVEELKQSDFVVLEDGKPQEIAFFAGESAPFDLVLLLDLSASSSKKLKLVRNSAKRFVEVARPIDRIAVVTFTDAAHVISPLTLDREALKKAIKKIEDPVGGTNFYDALRFVLEWVLPAQRGPRRSAVVVMTDGVDNALPDVFGDGSRTSFAELLERVRASDAIVFPVYLDTEQEEVKRHRSTANAYAIAREQLKQLADTGGTKVYPAKELKDLDQVYDQVIKDLGTVYSLGYRSSNKVRDGKWRTVAVQIIGRPGVTAHTKRGYFTRAEN
ncbi:MAG TPA: VWA domain-containing protein [Pyrinomonadaceae bacterium]|nr:VWA domain-containing protein [Pyrinomonadaceae bacterium]